MYRSAVNLSLAITAFPPPISNHHPAPTYHAAYCEHLKSFPQTASQVRKSGPDAGILFGARIIMFNRASMETFLPTQVHICEFLLLIYGSAYMGV